MTNLDLITDCNVKSTKAVKNMCAGLGI